ncbi:SNF2-related protein [Bergeyella zoohelcum]|uniref:N-formylmethionyl-tRNA deformylase n=1 Tax=Bergeyella zoohelcum TaxID=1015 RepID=A0A376C072_9FLAO|nr:DEAD/DEAH box helicase [Bergeyella zoohelcum]EKB60778.1 hypothetical protein HMPREF9700_00273 [Bergeyella zoohelcum CCUG 30536]SSZ47131.1 N-formylmethionyl-tRNA deformylase [Bergeyella zoohelcum]
MLEILQKRIKNSKIYQLKDKGIKRLYFPYIKNTPKMKISTWLEIVNDKLDVFVNVACENQHPNWETNKENEILEGLREKFRELINNCELQRRKVPLHERLRDDVVPVHSDSMLHQAQALRFCCSMKVTALFTDTGTGKSKIAIDLAISRYEAGQINKVLIFCPVSTKINFKKEIDKWGGAIPIEWKIVGIETMSSSELTVLNLLKWVDSETMIVVDESHLCKTPTAKRSRRIKACCEKASYKMIMTGTPAESVKDMFMQYSLLSDLIIGGNGWSSFEEKYLIKDMRGDVIAYKNVDYLMGLLEPYTYQVNKEEVMNLPDKTFKEIRCPLNENQEATYSYFKNELLEKLEQVNGDYVSPTLIFQYFGKLQQISCGFIPTEDGDVKDLGTTKFDFLEQVDYKNGQTIFFCKYLFELDKLVSYLGRENCAVFTGENRENRDTEKEDFTLGRRQFFVATMGSGGIGLNGLQHCNRIIFWSNSFKYNERKQCIGRIDRKGQERPMKIYDMRSDCGIEARIAANLKRKGNLSDEIKKLLKEKTKLKKYVHSL